MLMECSILFDGEYCEMAGGDIDSGQKRCFPKEGQHKQMQRFIIYIQRSHIFHLLLKPILDEYCKYSNLCPSQTICHYFSHIISQSQQLFIMKKYLQKNIESKHSLKKQNFNYKADVQEYIQYYFGMNVGHAVSKRRI